MTNVEAGHRVWLAVRWNDTPPRPLEDGCSGMTWRRWVVVGAATGWKGAESGQTKTDRETGRFVACSPNRRRDDVGPPLSHIATADGSSPR